MVLSKNHTKALALDAYDDGMKKAMLLLGAVIMAQNGILLIDEFETANSCICYEACIWTNY